MANLKISGMLVAIYILNLFGGTIFTNLGMKAVNIIMHHLHLLMFGVEVIIAKTYRLTGT